MGIVVNVNGERGISLSDLAQLVEKVNAQGDAIALQGRMLAAQSEHISKLESALAHHEEALGANIRSHESIAKFSEAVTNLLTDLAERLDFPFDPGTPPANLVVLRGGVDAQCVVCGGPNPDGSGCEFCPGLPPTG